MNLSINSQATRPQFKAIRIPTDEREQINRGKIDETRREILKICKNYNNRSTVGIVDGPTYEAMFFEDPKQENMAAKMLVNAGIDFQWSRKIDEYTHTAKLMWMETGLIPSDKEIANHGTKEELPNIDEALDMMTKRKDVYAKE